MFDNQAILISHYQDSLIIKHVPHQFTDQAILIPHYQDSLISKVMGYMFDNQGSIPNRGKNFLFSTASRTTLLSNGYGDCFPKGKLAGQ
jgi:hypothetical protein